MPGGIAAAIGARKINHQNRQIDPVAHHRGEGVGHLCLIPPDEGVIVERVCQRHERTEPVGKPRAVAVRNGRPVKLPLAGKIGGQPGFAARTAHGCQALSGQPSKQVKDLQNLHHLFRRVGLDHPAARQKGRGCRAVTCQRRRVRTGGVARCFGFS